MEAQKVDIFIMTKGKYFEGYQLQSIKKQLTDLSDEKWVWIQMLELKDPTIALVISLFGGTLGIDRFFIGDVGLGIGKLLTCGGFGIWAIVDWFLIMSATKDQNIRKLQETLLY
jgi:TM2 domain-containing membrane protein YozV